MMMMTMTKNTTLAPLATAALGGGLAAWSTNADAWASANRFGGGSGALAGRDRTHQRLGRQFGSTWRRRHRAHECLRQRYQHSVYGGTEHQRHRRRPAARAGYGAVTTAPGGASSPPPAGLPRVSRPSGLPHPPVAVPYYSTGCYGCAAAGAVVGVAAGAAIASSANAANTSTPMPPAWRQRQHRDGLSGRCCRWRRHGRQLRVMGASYASLPGGAMAVSKNGTTYCLSANTWFQPAFGANGVHYTVVAAP